MRKKLRIQLPWLAAGFTVWALGFVVIYSALSLGCTYGWQGIKFGPISLQRGILICLTLLSVLAAMGVAIKLRETSRNGHTMERRAVFTTQVAYQAAVAATVATAVTFSGIAFLSTC